MGDGGHVTVTGTAEQGQPAAAVSGGAGSDLTGLSAGLAALGCTVLDLTGVQGDADPVVCADLATVLVVVNAELEVQAVLQVDHLGGGDGHERTDAGPVGLNDGETVSGVLVTGLGRINGLLAVRIGLVVDSGVVTGVTVSSPHTLAGGRGRNSHHRNHGEDHDSGDDQSNQLFHGEKTPFNNSVMTHMTYVVTLYHISSEIATVFREIAEIICK